MNFKGLYLVLILLGFGRVHAQNYRVCVATFPDTSYPMAREIAAMADVFMKQDQNGLWHYYVGDFFTQGDADNARTQLLMQGYVDASVINLDEQKLWCGKPCPYFRDDFVYNHIGADGLMVSAIFYPTGVSRIPASGYKTLEEFSKILRENRDFRLYLGSHTDKKGTKQHNRELARWRLINVMRQMMTYNVVKRRMIPVIFGENLPLGGDPKFDRRVVLAIVDRDGQVVSRARAAVRIHDNEYQLRARK